jgi:hypothetical protein
VPSVSCLRSDCLLDAVDVLVSLQDHATYPGGDVCLKVDEA